MRERHLRPKMVGKSDSVVLIFISHSHQLLLLVGRAGDDAAAGEGVLDALAALLVAAEGGVVVAYCHAAGEEEGGQRPGALPAAATQPRVLATGRLVEGFLQ